MVVEMRGYAHGCVTAPECRTYPTWNPIGMRGAMAWYRAVLQCDGVPPAFGAEGAKCITANFASRTWHKNATCSWDGNYLTLSVENDFDRDGRAVMDELSDEVSACTRGGFDGDLRVISV